MFCAETKNGTFWWWRLRKLEYEGSSKSGSLYAPEIHIIHARNVTKSVTNRCFKPNCMGRTSPKCRLNFDHCTEPKPSFTHEISVEKKWFLYQAFYIRELRNYLCWTGPNPDGSVGLLTVVVVPHFLEYRAICCLQYVTFPFLILSNWYDMMDMLWSLLSLVNILCSNVLTIWPWK